MKTRFLVAISIAALTFVAVACHAYGSYSQKGIVSAEDRVPIPPGQSTGAWEGRDLSVEYRYSREQSSLDLLGTVQFALYMFFSYQGSAIEAGGNGGGGSKYFWYYPH